MPSVPQPERLPQNGNGSSNGHVGNGHGHTDDTVTVNDGAHDAATVEFSGSSDATIAEAVREALACASRTLPTLHGAGVRVIPQLALEQGVLRFRVTLRVTAPATPPSPTSVTP